MINIERELFQASAHIRTIDAYQKFMREAKGNPIVHPYEFDGDVGEAHIYENGNIIFHKSKDGIVLSIYSVELGIDRYYQA